MDASMQKRRLQKRQGDLAEALWTLNERNHYQDFVSFVDIRLKNDDTLIKWQKLANQTLSPFIKYL
jgi:hypothetical protein